MESIEHKGEEMTPTVEADVTSQSPQVIKKSLTGRKMVAQELVVAVEQIEKRVEQQ